MKENNPFTLTFGMPPTQLIQRVEDSDQILSSFNVNHPISRTYLIEGVRGSGKTVLMSTVANTLQADKDWIVVNLNPTQDLLNSLANRLGNTIRNIPNFLEKGFNLSAFGIGVGVGGTENTKDDVSVIENMLRYIKKKHKHLLITIDEVISNATMRVFASQFQIFLREDYPIYLIMTGLYENIYSIQNDPSLTFLLRSPKIRIQPLSLSQITRHYRQVFDIGLDEAKKLADLTKGYAFAFQALGLLYWEYRDTLAMEEILVKYDDMLDGYVYQKVWEGLSEQDRKIVLSLEDEEGIAIKDLMERLSIPSTSFTKYRSRLINKGVLFAPMRGYLSLALPRFKQIAELY